MVYQEELEKLGRANIWGERISLGLKCRKWTGKVLQTTENKEQRKQWVSVSLWRHHRALVDKTGRTGNDKCWIRQSKTDDSFLQQQNGNHTMFTWNNLIYEALIISQPFSQICFGEFICGLVRQKIKRKTGTKITHEMLFKKVKFGAGKMVKRTKPLPYVASIPSGCRVCPSSSTCNGAAFWV